MSNTTKRIAIFYHVAHLGDFWLSVDEQITKTLVASGLIERADLLIRNDCKRADLFEFPTLNMLHEFAKTSDFYILYLHTKGVTQPTPSVSDWRECMLYWVVERWRECVAKLDAGFDAVGINVIDSPVKHFQGNFWWATTKLIRQLDRVETVQYVPTHSNQTERHKAEFWLLGKGARAYAPYHHHLNPYLTRNPRASYVGRKF